MTAYRGFGQVDEHVLLRLRFRFGRLRRMLHRRLGHRLDRKLLDRFFLLRRRRFGTDGRLGTKHFRHDEIQFVIVVMFLIAKHTGHPPES